MESSNRRHLQQQQQPWPVNTQPIAGHPPRTTTTATANSLRLQVPRSAPAYFQGLRLTNPFSSSAADGGGFFSGGGLPRLLNVFDETATIPMAPATAPLRPLVTFSYRPPPAPTLLDDGDKIVLDDDDDYHTTTADNFDEDDEDELGDDEVGEIVR